LVFFSLENEFSAGEKLDTHSGSKFYEEFEYAVKTGVRRILSHSTERFSSDRVFSSKWCVLQRTELRNAMATSSSSFPCQNSPCSLKKSIPKNSTPKTAKGASAGKRIVCWRKVRFAFRLKISRGIRIPGQNRRQTHSKPLH